MQSAILAKNASNQICSKMVFAGDLTQVDVFLVAFQTKYPTHTFTKYDDDQDPAFVAATIEVYENIN